MKPFFKATEKKNLVLGLRIEISVFRKQPLFRNMKDLLLNNEFLKVVNVANPKSDFMFLDEESTPIWLEYDENTTKTKRKYTTAFGKLRENKLSLYLLKLKYYDENQLLLKKNIHFALPSETPITLEKLRKGFSESRFGILVRVFYQFANEDLRKMYLPEKIYKMSLKDTYKKH